MANSYIGKGQAGREDRGERALWDEGGQKKIK